MNYSKVINAILSLSVVKQTNEQTNNTNISFLKAQFLKSTPRIYIPPTIQSLSRYPDTSLPMKPKGNYTVIGFTVIAIWHCAFQPPGSQFLLEWRRLGIVALMKSLSIYRDVKLWTDSAPNPTSTETWPMSGGWTYTCTLLSFCILNRFQLQKLYF